MPQNQSSYVSLSLPPSLLLSLSSSLPIEGPHSPRSYLNGEASLRLFRITGGDIHGMLTFLMR